MNNVRMQEFFGDEERVNELAAAATCEEAAEILNRYGTDVTVDEVRSMYDQGVELMEKDGMIGGGELTESGLELVCGGRSRRYNTGKTLVAVGTCVCVAGAACCASGAGLPIGIPLACIGAGLTIAGFYLMKPDRYR